MANVETSRFKESDFEFHRPVDDTDPGFSIKGCKFRWLSAGVEVRRAARIWIPLKLSMMPKKVQDRLKEHQPRWFNEGDTVRKKDLTLAFAPIEEVDRLKKEIKRAQDLNENVLKNRVSHGHQVQSQGSMTAARDESANQFM